MCRGCIFEQERIFEGKGPERAGPVSVSHKRDGRVPTFAFPSVPTFARGNARGGRPRRVKAAGQANWEEHRRNTQERADCYIRVRKRARSLTDNRSNDI